MCDTHQEGFWIGTLELEGDQLKLGHDASDRSD